MMHSHVEKGRKGMRRGGGEREGSAKESGEGKGARRMFEEEEGVGREVWE